MVRIDQHRSADCNCIPNRLNPVSPKTVCVPSVMQRVLYPMPYICAPFSTLSSVFSKVRAQIQLFDVLGRQTCDAHSARVRCQPTRAQTSHTHSPPTDYTRDSRRCVFFSAPLPVLFVRILYVCVCVFQKVFALVGAQKQCVRFGWMLRACACVCVNTISNAVQIVQISQHTT